MRRRRRWRWRPHSLPRLNHLAGNHHRKIYDMTLLSLPVPETYKYLPSTYLLYSAIHIPIS